MGNITAVIPHKRGTAEAWLRQAIGSLPKGTPYIVAENDGELAQALNEGVKAAQTEYVLRLDADDALKPGALDFLLSGAWDADVVYPSQLLCDEDLKPKELLKASEFCPNRLLVAPYITGTGLLARREKLLKYRDLPILEDWDWHVRMVAAGARYKPVPEAIVLRRPGRRNKSSEPVTVLQEMHRQIVGVEPDLKATFYYQASPATTYWRCLLPARYLPGQAINHAAIRPVTEQDLEFPEHRGAGVFQFPGDLARSVLMAEMQERGFRVLVESDDSYFERSPQGTPGWDDTVRGGWHSFEVHRKILPWVDGIIVTTPHLAGRYRKHTNAPVYVCPNQIDPADWPEPMKEETLRVGWFASPSHRGDSELVRRALDWASRQPGVEVVTMGHDPGWRFPRRHVPWSNDLGVYRQVISTLAIGLAPVVETPWAACRSDLKALEYGMAGAAPIVSDVTPYKTYEGPCLRAKDARDFYHHVKHLVHHPDEARQLAKAAREYVMAERTMERNIGLWAEAVDG